MAKLNRLKNLSSLIFSQTLCRRVSFLCFALNFPLVVVRSPLHLAHARDKSKVKIKPERGTTGMLSQAMLAQGRAIIVGLSGSSIATYVASRSRQKGGFRGAPLRKKYIGTLKVDVLQYD
ncbi:hypothetical protein [Planctobacterium marinum]|uniref:hypothetical protein n=1 Tax=Planctobacterium marinum TaxID=1631968 RepID=UPI0030C74316